MISLIDDFQNDFQFFALVERRRIFKFPPPLLLATIKMTTVLKTKFFPIAYFGSQHYCIRGQTRVSVGRRRDRRPPSRGVRPAWPRYAAPPGVRCRRRRGCRMSSGACSSTCTRARTTTWRASPNAC